MMMNNSRLSEDLMMMNNSRLSEDFLWFSFRVIKIWELVIVFQGLVGLL
jgi:hypothetical protein